MEITNLINGYVKINYLNKTFILQLPHQVLDIIDFKDLSEDGILIAMCNMANGNKYIKYIKYIRYIRYIDLSCILKLLEIDKILISKEKLH